MPICLQRGCPVIVPSGRCPTHQEGERLHRLYRTARWKRLREQKRQDNPFCVDCTAQGKLRLWDDLDHEVPHRGNLELFWDYQNLRGLCHQHHSAKTARGE